MAGFEQRGRDYNTLVQASGGSSVIFEAGKSEKDDKLVSSMLGSIRQFRDLFSRLTWLRFDRNEVVTKCTDPPGMMRSLDLRSRPEGHSWRFLIELSLEKGLIRTVDVANLKMAKDMVRNHGGTSEVICRSRKENMVHVCSFSASLRDNRYQGFIIISMSAFIDKWQQGMRWSHGTPILE